MAGSIKTFRDLEVYKLAHELAMKIFVITKDFPAEERHSLTDQIRRSARSVAVNIAEGWGKRNYENTFKRHLMDAAGSTQETKSWLLFALDCGYLEQSEFVVLWDACDGLGGMIFRLHQNWKTPIREKV